MRNVLPLVALALATVGCAKEIEVTEGDCSDLLFETFAAADFTNEDDVEAGEEALQGLLLGMHNNCMDDVDLDFKDRTLNPGFLSTEFLDGLPVPSGGDPAVSLDEQTPVGLPGRSVHPMSKHLEGMQMLNQNCLGSSSTRYHLKTWTANEECFFDGSCASATSDSRSFIKNPVAKIWMDSKSDYYRTTIPFESGDADAVVSRGWIETVFNSGHDGDGGSQWRQRYVLDVYYANPDDPSQTLRYYMYWAEADIVGLGDDYFVSQVVEGLDENYVNVDAFYSGEICDDRDLTEAQVREDL